MFISKLDASGNFVWAKTMGGAGDPAGTSIAIDASANVYTTGWFSGTVDFDPGSSVFNITAVAGSSDIFISKLNSSGNFVWAKALGGGGEGSALALDVSGNIYATGHFYGTTDFDPGTGTFNLTSSGSTYDIFVSKLNNAGNFVWAKQIGGTSNDEGYSVATDVSGNVYIIGGFQGAVDFDPGAGTFNLTSAGAYDIFISKLDDLGNFIWAK